MVLFASESVLFDSGLVLNGVLACFRVGSGWFWVGSGLVLAHCSWFWVGSGRFWLVSFSSDWFWLTLLGSGWSWLALVGSGWLWLVLLGSGWVLLGSGGFCLVP